MKKVIVSREELEEKLEELYRIAGNGNVNAGGHTQLYARVDDKGKVVAWHKEDVFGNSWIDSDEYVLLVDLGWFSPLNLIDYQGWWECEEEELLIRYPKWEEYKANDPIGWEEMMNEWCEEWLDIHAPEWAEGTADTIYSAYAPPKELVVCEA